MLIFMTPNDYNERQNLSKRLTEQSVLSENIHELYLFAPELTMEYLQNKLREESTKTREWHGFSTLESCSGDCQPEHGIICLAFGLCLRQTHSVFNIILIFMNGTRNWKIKRWRWFISFMWLSNMMIVWFIPPRILYHIFDVFYFVVFCDRRRFIKLDFQDISFSHFYASSFEFNACKCVKSIYDGRGKSQFGDVIINKCILCN